VKVIENPKIQSIKPIIKYQFDDIKKSLNANSALYMMDNMMLTKLRQDIKRDQTVMMRGFHRSKVIIIPDVVLEEAIANIKSEIEFQKTYGHLFQILSAEHDVCIVDMEIMLQLLRDMLGTQENALYVLIHIAQEAVRTNRKILDAIREMNIHSKDVLDKLRNAIIHNGKNTGERFLTIFSLVFLCMYYGPVYIVSEDEKGVYGPYRTFLNNEQLLELIHIKNTEEFIANYQFISYEAILQSIYHREGLEKTELLDLIEGSSRDSSRRMLYSLNGEPFYTEVPNKKLAEWITSGIIHIKF